MMTATKSSKLKSMALAALIGVNALLVTALVCRHTPENRAMAAGANVGDVLAVPGQLLGLTDGVVFLLDTRNQKLSLISVDTGNRNTQVQSLPALDLDKLLNGAGGVKGK